MEYVNHVHKDIILIVNLYVRQFHHYVNNMILILDFV